MTEHRTATSTSLLDGLKDRDNDRAWSDLVGRYRPVIIGFARNLGLSEDDAADVAQQALSEFSREYLEGRYQRGRGRLGSWLMGIAHHRAIDALRARARRRDHRGESAFLDHVGDDHLSRTWTTAQQACIRDEALARLRQSSRIEERTLRAFELVVMRNMPAAEVARECGMKTADVYVAKTRVTSRLREIVAEITAAYDLDS